MYVVALEFDTDKTDYKVFSGYADAKRRYDQGFIAWWDVKPVGKDRRVYVERVLLVKIEEADTRKAMERVKDGQGEILEDTYGWPHIDLDLDE